MIVKIELAHKLNFVESFNKLEDKALLDHIQQGFQRNVIIIQGGEILVSGHHSPVG